MSKLQTYRKSEQVGVHKSRQQRYSCTFCGSRYTPKPKWHGCSEKLRLQAIRMYVDGMGFRQIGRHLQVDHVTVMNWVKSYASRLPETEVHKEAYTVEMDEFYTFIGKKKNRVYIMTFVDRETRCILAWKVIHRRNGYKFQEILAESVPGHDYYSDDYQGYKTVLYSPATIIQ